MNKVTVHKAKRVIESITVEQGDVIVTKNGTHYLLVRTGDSCGSGLKLICLCQDIGNRIFDRSFSDGSSLKDVIRFLNTYSSSLWDDIELIKKDNYSLTLEY